MTPLILVPLDFGNVVPGSTPFSSSAVGVTYSNVTLDGPSDATLNSTPSVYGSSLLTGQSASTYVSWGANVHLSGCTGSGGNYYARLGGSLGSVPTSQTTGSYSGVFTMTVGYQGIILSVTRSHGCPPSTPGIFVERTVLPS